ncbi:MAG: xanthine dehydrogenase family protein molybdopterin-binding subunit [Alphaproteobacteria bacterium]|jgi:carbon-monoxide dehydrogenase large subunit
MVKFGVGQSVKRVEDPRLLTGNGRYTDDIQPRRQAHAYFVRSPHAHASFTKVDTAAAAKAPGVLAVVTGADLQAAGIGNVPCLVPLKNRDGSSMPMTPRPALAVGRARFVGDAVAMVVAETLAEAKDAAELVEIDWNPLPATTDIEASAKPGAPQVWDFAKNNQVFDWELGDEKATAAAFAKAHRVVTMDFVNNRLVPNSMEPRNAIGEVTPDGRLQLTVSSQGGSGLRKVLADKIFKVPENKVRVVTPDVGGGFGMKIFLFCEYVPVLFAARMLGRAVKWTGERGEAFLADTHGRDHKSRAELAVDRDNRFIGIRVTVNANLGAYLSHYGPFIPTDLFAWMVPGCYAFPVAWCNVKGVYTNTSPVDAYRGAGRPEAAYMIERLVDKAARELGVAPDELRRINFIRPDQMPFKTPMGQTYDSGDFATTMAAGMKAADWAGFAARKAESRKRGKLRGIGLSYYIEVCGGAPDESAQVRVDSAGGATVLIGNQSNGQGHETAYAQIVAEKLGIPFESIRVVQGDTDLAVYPGGTGGSRAASVGGSAIWGACDRIIAKGRKFAAQMLEAAESDIEFKDGSFTVVGTDRSKSFHQVAQAAFDMGKIPAGMSPGLDETSNMNPAAATYPNGAHVCEVEIDEGTGVASVVRYTITDDFGKVINPLLLAGQVHGGTAQGIGQALFEGARYDEETGQLLTGSFMDYCMPRAGSIPDISFAYTEACPTTANPLGVKGCGEAGAIGAPPAVINAVVDALSSYGITHIDMPATPEKIWRVISSGSVKQAAE